MGRRNRRRSAYDHLYLLHRLGIGDRSSVELLSVSRLIPGWDFLPANQKLPALSYMQDEAEIRRQSCQVEVGAGQGSSGGSPMRTSPHHGGFKRRLNMSWGGQTIRWRRTGDAGEITNEGVL